MKTFKLAWRNVWRNKRRTLATVSAMSLALLIMILYSGIVAGYMLEMERTILDFEMGDMQIFAGDYRENPSLYTRVENADALIAKLEAANFSAAPRLLAAGLAAAGDASGGVTLRGVDPERDRSASLVYQRVDKGRWVDEKDPGGVVLGRRLARTLNVKPGDELVLLTQGADGSTANEIYKVRGVLKSVGDITDRTGVFMTMDAFRNLMIMPEGVHQIIIRKPPDRDLESAATEVRAIAAQLDAKTWRELVPTLAQMFDSAKSVVYVMFFIVYIAIGILILNAMLMAVFERIREFGVLKAIGMGPRQVLSLILAESAVQTGLALAAGVLLSVPGNWYLTTRGLDLGTFTDLSVAGLSIDSNMRAVVSVGTYVGPIAALVLIVLVAVTYPAVKAALIRPVEAIHHH